MWLCTVLFIRLYKNVKCFIPFPSCNIGTLWNGIQKNCHLDESVIRIPESSFKQIFGYGSLLLAFVVRFQMDNSYACWQQLCSLQAPSCKFITSLLDKVRMSQKRNWKSKSKPRQCVQVSSSVCFNLIDPLPCFH